MLPIQRAIDEEIRRLAADGPTPRELEQAMNSMEAQFLSSIQTVNGKADQLERYYYRTGQPDGFQRELDSTQGRHRGDVRRVVQHTDRTRAIVSMCRGTINQAAARRTLPHEASHPADKLRWRS